MAALVYIVVFLALTGYSSATYCLCKDGVGDQNLQKALDYACGAGADCTPILQNGACYLPNTVKDHCSYAVNSYFQRKGQVQGSCDFSGTATQSANPPSTQNTSCVFPSSSSQTGTTPTTPTGTTPTTPTGTTPTGTPTTGTPTTGTPTTGTTPTTTTPTGGTTIGNTSPGFGISPAGGTTFDGSGDVALSPGSYLFLNSALTFLWFSGFLLRN